MRTFEDMQLSEVMDMLNNPDKHRITFGEFMLLAQKMTAMQAEVNNALNPNSKPAEAKDEYLRKKVNKLEKRVEELEDKLSKMSRARIVFDEDGDEMWI